jgi:hypothetical protein
LAARQVDVREFPQILTIDAVPKRKISVPNVASTLVLSLGEMERRVSKLTYLFAAVIACGAEVSCGAGVHDADQVRSITKDVAAGGYIDFMQARLDICETCLSAPTANIRFTWNKTIDYAGALSAVYDLEVEGPQTFQKDPKITISTTSETASNGHNVIGFMVPPPGESVWIPNTSPSSDGCDSGTVCGPVQSQSFSTTNILRLAIVTECYQGVECPQGQSCARANACQQCPKDSPCQ